VSWLSDRLFQFRYWVLRKLHAVDKDHYQALLDGYVEIVSIKTVDLGESRRECERLKAELERIKGTAPTEPGKESA
jgi:hypothetical protein